MLYIHPTDLFTTWSFEIRRTTLLNFTTYSDLLIVNSLTVEGPVG